MRKYVAGALVATAFLAGVPASAGVAVRGEAVPLGVTAVGGAALPAGAHAPADCDQLTPATSVVPAAIPLGARKPVKLRLLVLASAEDLAAAKQAATGAAKAYAPLGITLKPTYKTIAVPALSDEATAWLAHAKKLTRGQRPAGVDAVYLATSKTLDSGGLADCIGGIADNDSAFAVGMLQLSGIIGVTVKGLDLPIDPSKDGPPIPNGGALTLAHELGHLLGAHHHYGEYCEPTATDPQHSCDLMQTLSFQTLGLRFGPVSGAVIRDQASRYLT